MGQRGFCFKKVLLQRLHGECDPACTCDKALAGGPERFGFPDDGYCQRVLEDLRGGWIYLDTFAVMKVFHVVEAVT